MSDTCQNCHDPNNGMVVGNNRDNHPRLLFYYICFSCYHMSVSKHTYKVHKGDEGWWLWDNNPLTGKHEWKRASIDEEHEFSQAYKMWIAKTILQED